MKPFILWSIWTVRFGNGNQGFFLNSPVVCANPACCGVMGIQKNVVPNPIVEA